MMFSEVAQHIERKAGFPITDMRVLPEGMTAVLTAQTADGQYANATLYLGDEQLAHPELIHVLALDACAALQRYVDSFVPGEPPQWDKMQWAP